MTFEEAMGEGLKETEKNHIENQRKVYICVAMGRITLSPLIMCKMENIPNELNDLAKNF